MSTNPFDSTFEGTQSQQQQQQRRLGSHSRPSAGGGSNSSASTSHHHQARRGNTNAEPSIWAARHVEWPIPAALSLATYQRLAKASRQAGQQLGISMDSSIAQQQSSGGGGTVSTATTKSISVIGGGSIDASMLNIDTSPMMDNDVRSDAGTDTTASSSNYYVGLSGFMSRVLNPSTTTATATSSSSTGGALSSSLDHNSKSNDSMDHFLNASGDNSTGRGIGDQTRSIRPPRPGCVAASNGWIVAALECEASPSVGPDSVAVVGNNGTKSTSPTSVLRLVSRWNVRRGGMADQWIALPPPMGRSFSRIRHVFVDPTASHTLFSAANGEAYYIHSSQQKQVIKLAGFGPLAETSTGQTTSSGSHPSIKVNLTGIPATAVAHRRDEASQAAVQAGLTIGSYVTAVAWDKDRGTEGSSKRILLGTSAGEIYEYSLISPTSAEQDDSTLLPILLHKLYHPDAAADMSEVGAAVTGLYFERLRTGLLVLAATSGRHKRTRFYTFYSAHNSSFRMVMADQQHASLTELPGSVDFSDLRLCNDHFALRTATGIYYGTIDRSLAGPAVLSGGSNMVVDSGILPYDGGKGGIGIGLPVSIAVTPHHIITLSEGNDLRFINRVALKVIQKERVDLVVPGSSSTDDESQTDVGELMMDIRRPDQVWLRKGRSLVHISSSQEDRDVWKFTLQKCFELPPKARGDNPPPTPQAANRGMLHLPRLGENHELSEDEKAQEALFEQSKTLCTNAAQKAVVMTVRAEYHLLHGRAELAAKYLAQCPPVLEPFADTAIRLALPKLGVDDSRGYRGSREARISLESSNIPLITYLSDRMRVARISNDKMTCTMIGAWLTELFLHERGEQLTAAALGRGVPPKDVEASQRAFLAQFLNANVDNMHAKTVVKILKAHDVGASECSSYAAKSGDIATAVSAALSAGARDASGAFDALRILNDAPFELAEPLYYKHASTLLARVPAAAGESFLARYGQGLSPLRLLPFIMSYEKNRKERARIQKALDLEKSAARPSGGKEESKSSFDVTVDDPVGSTDGFELKLDPSITNVGSFVNDSSVAIKYLEGVVKQGCRSSAVYSYLVSLYAALEDEEPLYQFLSTHVPHTSAVADATKKAFLKGEKLPVHSDDLMPTSLDMSNALRTVLSTGRHFRSAIKLYMGFGMRQQAVELALKVDPSLARELAQDSVELDERKRLWLMIARSAASGGSLRGGKDIVSRVVSVLKDCGPDVLSIEDVLPFLPDFCQIDEIKDEICEALTSYSSKIEGFFREMSDCDSACGILREEIRRLRNYHMRMKADARCALTNKTVLNACEPFYVFPSGYVVLASALKREVMPHLNDKQRARVAELEKRLSTQVNADSRLSLQIELDGLIAAECPLTGSIMIESIDMDFEDSTEIYEGEGIAPKSIERADV